MSLLRKQLIKYLDNISLENKSIADVGCGTRPVSKYIRHKNCTFTTFDIEEKHKPDKIIDLSKNILMSVNIGMSENYFDIVFCIEVLEHIKNTMQALKNLHFLLKTGGTMYLSLPFFCPIHGNSDYFRFVPAGIKNILLDIGFKDIEITEFKISKGKEAIDKFLSLEQYEASKNRYLLTSIIKATK